MRIIDLLDSFLVFRVFGVGILCLSTSRFYAFLVFYVAILRFFYVFLVSSVAI